MGAPVIHIMFSRKIFIIVFTVGATTFRKLIDEVNTIFFSCGDSVGIRTLTNIVV